MTPTPERCAKCACGHDYNDHWWECGHSCCYHSEDGETFCACNEFAPAPPREEKHYNNPDCPDPTCEIEFPHDNQSHVGNVPQPSADAAEEIMLDAINRFGRDALLVNVTQSLKEAISAALAAERERCAKIAEGDPPITVPPFTATDATDLGMKIGKFVCKHIAAAIRDQK